MSLFSADPNLAPADRAAEYLWDVQTFIHDALSWRADSLRAYADGLDMLKQNLERELASIADRLASGIGQNHPEQPHELRADDDRQGG